MNHAFLSAASVSRFAGNAVFDNCGSNVFRDQFGRLRCEESVCCVLSCCEQALLTIFLFLFRILTATGGEESMAKVFP